MTFNSFCFWIKTFFIFISNPVYNTASEAVLGGQQCFLSYVLKKCFAFEVSVVDITLAIVMETLQVFPSCSRSGRTTPLALYSCFYKIRWHTCLTIDVIREGPAPVCSSVQWITHVQLIDKWFVYIFSSLWRHTCQGTCQNALTGVTSQGHVNWHITWADPSLTLSDKVQTTFSTITTTTSQLKGQTMLESIERSLVVRGAGQKDDLSWKEPTNQRYVFLCHLTLKID